MQFESSFAALFFLFFFSPFCRGQDDPPSPSGLSNATKPNDIFIWPSTVTLHPVLQSFNNGVVLSPLTKARLERNVPQLSIPSIANLALENTELELQEDLAEETTTRSLRQVGSGFLYRNNRYNPAVNPSYNPYDPLSTRSNDPLSPNYTPLTTFDTIAPRQDDGFDAFSARRVAQFSLGLGTKIRFADTVTQLGTSWDPDTSEFTPTLAGIFFFTFNAVSERFSHFRISLQLNGADVVSAFGDVSGYQMAGNSVMVRMSAGDTVYLSLQEGRLFDTSSSRAYTTFSGFRLL